MTTIVGQDHAPRSGLACESVTPHGDPHGMVLGKAIGISFRLRAWLTHDDVYVRPCELCVLCMTVRSQI